MKKNAKKSEKKAKTECAGKSGKGDCCSDNSVLAAIEDIHSAIENLAEASSRIADAVEEIASSLGKKDVVEEWEECDDDRRSTSDDDDSEGEEEEDWK